MNRAVVLLLISFGATTGMASALDSTTELDSCLQRPHTERLECLDKLTRTIAPHPRQSPEDEWIVSLTTSPIDYSPIATATTSSRSGIAEAAMQLSIRCRGGQTELMLTGPGIAHEGRGDAISYRVNDSPAVQVAAGTPTSGPGIAFTGDVVRLLQSLPNSGDLIVQLSPRGGTTYVGTFSLAGLESVRTKMAAACKWSRAIAAPGH